MKKTELRKILLESIIDPKDNDILIDVGDDVYYVMSAYAILKNVLNSPQKSLDATDEKLKKAITLLAIARNKI